MGKSVFDISAAQSWIKRWVDTLIYGKYSQEIINVSTDRPIFFCKVKPHTATVINLKVEKANFLGSVNFVVTVADKSDLNKATIAVMSTSIPAFFDGSEIYLATSVDGLLEDYIFIGFSVPTPGISSVSMQAVSSERNGVKGVAYSVGLAAIPYVVFKVSDGYLAGYPAIKTIKMLDAFHEWSPMYQYEGESPVFFHGSAYFANPVLVPNAGESPSSAPAKWIQLARTDPGPMDITEGARTPQVFYQPGLIISNSTAVKLRKAHQDQGLQYPSSSSKVYHLDGDLLDQDQLNSLAIGLRVPEFDFNEIADSAFPFNDVLGSLFAWNMADTGNNVLPHFISEDSEPESLVTNDPAISRKPFKEIAEAYYGSFCVPFILPSGNGQNVLDYWFKPVEAGVFTLISIKLPTGELFDLAIGYEEPFWNDNAGVGAPNNFPFNENVLLPGTVPYNQRSVSAGLNAVQGYGGISTVTPISFSIANLPQLNIWSHISIRIELNSIVLFLNGQQTTISRLSSGFGGNTSIIINPQRGQIVLDEIMTDWTASISFSRYTEVSMNRYPWAYHEWKDGWLTIYADNPDKLDSNLAMHFFPVGSVITQTTTNGAYNDSQTPWARFHNFRQSQFVLQGEVIPAGGNGEKTRFWQRIS
jgi:hypothetical protein